eukprot:Gb_33649 [translate_table: standard]
MNSRFTPKIRHVMKYGHCNGQLVLKVTDNKVNMLMEGEETSTMTMEWCMDELLRKPNIMKKVQKEIKIVVDKYRKVKESNMPNVEYMQCLVKETLRLHPSVPLLPPHLSIERCIVDEYHLPPKMRLLVNAWVISTNPMVWEDPLAFKPKRFMGTDIGVKGQVFEGFYYNFNK